MSETRPTIEIIAPTVEEAIANGLNDLGMTEEDVDIEILDEGTRGLFGLGSRQARVRLSIKSPSSSPQISTAETQPPIQTSTAADLPEQTPEPIKETVISEVDKSEDEVLKITRETVIELLQRMRVIAQVTAHYGEVDDKRGRIPVHLDIHGKDLSILIGRQAETLNALQYITGLIVGKELGRSVPLFIDVEGYRKRREKPGSSQAGACPGRCRAR